MFIGREDLYNEFKEFRFNINKCKFNNKIASKYCENNKFEFNELVVDNILQYIKNYIPKYYCSFLNSKIEGNMYIGVNDYGFIKGIPYQGELDTEYFNNKIMKTLYKNIKHPNNFDFEPTIKINWIKLETYDIKIDSEISPQYTNYLIEKQKYNERYNKWLEELDDWKIRFAFAGRKLIDIVNTPESRIILINYIKTHDSNSPIIKLLETDYKIDYKDHTELIPLKEDPSNPYYWVVRWKDEMIDKLKKEKPLFNNEFPQYNVPINLITNIGEMVPYWIKNNNNMNLYVLHIIIKLNNVLDNYTFSFLESKTKNIWTTNYRSVLPDGSPTSISYKLVQSK
jgi:hypothetical protein